MSEFLKRNNALVAWFLTVVASIVASYFGFKPPPLPIIQERIVEVRVPADADVPPPDGWINDPDAVKVAVKAIEAQQGFTTDFSRIAKDAIATDNDASFFSWDAEGKILKKVLDSWDQGPVGTCVSFGWGRGCQDLMLIQIFKGGIEEWPGYQVATEPIYAGSRVEVGGGRIAGDGSVGAWAGQWVQGKKDVGGILLQKQYGSIDLSTYSPSRARSWGRTGCPNELESAAAEHRVQGIAMVTSSAEVWTAIGNGYPVPVCSDVGFDSPLKDGFCARRGSWGHCMLVRGRFIHPSRGRCFVIQNSWGDYLRSKGNPNSMIETKDRGKVQLPTGCFAVPASDIDVIVRQKDSFAISSFRGFPAQKLDWFAKNKPEVMPQAMPAAEGSVAAWATRQRQRREPEYALAP